MVGAAGIELCTRTKWATCAEEQYRDYAPAGTEEVVNS
jgi:hypothetical protein